MVGPNKTWLKNFPRKLKGKLRRPKPKQGKKNNEKIDHKLWGSEAEKPSDSEPRTPKPQLPRLLRNSLMHGCMTSLLNLGVIGIR